MGRRLPLATPGGTVDLRTGILRPADPADRLTRMASVTPAEPGTAAAACPLWRRFVADLAGGDPTTAAFLQRFCGYALTGATSEHALVFLLGAGGNGKSVFANILHAVLGTYAAVAAPDLLASGGTGAGKAHSAEVAALAGARLVVAAEVEEGRVWAEGRLKLLTAGDPVTARFAGRNPFTFTPRFKLICTGNAMPALQTVDAALRRRLHVVPVAHRPAVPDRDLPAKLWAEAPGILRWMIDGCLKWQGLEPGAAAQGEAGQSHGQSGAEQGVEARGYKERYDDAGGEPDDGGWGADPAADWADPDAYDDPDAVARAGAAGDFEPDEAWAPPSDVAQGGADDSAAGVVEPGLGHPPMVAAATTRYFGEQDMLALFLADRCEPDPAARVPALDLYEAWKAFNAAAGEPPGTQRRFAARLDRHFASVDGAGYGRERSNCMRYYCGLRLVVQNKA